jgi:5-hydroxyisourate hydrolase-like protein (transthyretin family)
MSRKQPVVEVTMSPEEQAETDRLNRVNDVEKAIIQHQETIKELRVELRKLEGKTKREGPSKMELATAYYNDHPGLKRKEYVEAFMKDIGLTVAASRTYIQLIIKRSK